MFDVTDYQDISPEDMRELMAEMKESEQALNLEALTRWLEEEYPVEMGADAPCA